MNDDGNHNLPQYVYRIPLTRAQYDVVTWAVGPMHD